MRQAYVCVVEGLRKRAFEESGRAWKVSQASCRERRGFLNQESGKHLMGENTREDVRQRKADGLPGAGWRVLGPEKSAFGVCWGLCPPGSAATCRKACS